MKSSMNPLAVGMFVLGSAIIAVAAIIIFGSFKFFANTEMFISYFPETVNGLDVGAAVKYKGVKIGKVEDIRIGPQRKDIRETSVIVVYSIDVDMVRRKSDNKKELDFDQWMERQVANGMRAKLNYQSIVTGMLYIELDYIADKNEPYHKNYEGLEYTEIPSSKSGLSELAKAFEDTLSEISKINFKEITDNVNAVLVSVNAKINDVDTKEISDRALVALGSINELANDKNIRLAIKNFDTLLKDANTEIKSLSEAGKKTLSNGDGGLENVNTIVAPQSPIRYELALLFRSLNESMNSISNFADYLERNPNAILTGKSAKEKENQ